jgi:hypothetical protein
MGRIEAKMDIRDDRRMADLLLLSVGTRAMKASAAIHANDAKAALALINDIEGFLHDARIHTESLIIGI